MRIEDRGLIPTAAFGSRPNGAAWDVLSSSYRHALSSGAGHETVHRAFVFDPDHTMVYDDPGR